jgi:uncharacterized repeat protein (TIGR03806 family)
MHAGLGVLGAPAVLALALTGCAPGEGEPEHVAGYVEDCVAQDRPVGRSALALEPVFEGLSFNAPIALVQAPGARDRYHVAERAGRVLAIEDPGGGASPVAQTVLDIRGQVSTQGEGGLLGLAFHPDYPATPEAFVSYTIPGSPLVSRLSRFAVAADGQFGGEEILLALEQPFANHNGGWIAFGPDGYLYLGLGDGGAAGDPRDHAQNTQSLFGALLRLDVDSAAAPGKAYAVPADNVFAANGARPGAGAPEIYAWGLRNPWRWSFDRVTGDLWLGDVGQNAWEEIDRIESGANYGWRCYEGTHAFETAGCADASAYAAPVAEYGHDQGCSVTGGYVYRGNAVGDLAGVYLYGDFCSGRIWGLAGDGAAEPVELLDTPYSIASFAQDNAGEVYVLHLASPGGIFRIVPASDAGAALEPGVLSETGCGTAGDPAQPAAGLIAYSVNAPFWSDSAAKTRWLSLPPGGAIDVESDLDWTLPQGSVVRKDFRLDGRLVETRLFMRHTDGEWAGYSFRWNDAQTDASLLAGAEDLAFGGRTWHFPSPNECTDCHTAAAGRSLGLETAQLNGPGPGGMNQLTALAQAGVFSAPLPDTPGNLPRLEDPYGSGPLPERARSYLHTNCAQCHRPGGPTPAGGMDLRYGTALADMGICDTPPQSGDLGIANARLLAPGDPGRSVLPARMDRRDAFGMPPLASLEVDVDGVALVADWIAGVTACP